MANNEKKYKLIKSKGNLYKKTKNRFYPAMNLGNSFNMGLKYNDSKMGLGLVNRGGNVPYSNGLSKIISEQSDLLSINPISYNINKNLMYKSLWGSTPKFNQAIESLKKEMI